VNEGPTCCTEKSYWGAAEKACDVDQYGAPPMDGSKEDVQAGCTEKSYWGVVKKACDIDQYGAPPMDGSKDGQAGAPTVVLGGRQRRLGTIDGCGCPWQCYLRGPRGQWHPWRCLRGHQ
jgi:hypothetical protein